jgi:hypothetical protein
MKTTLMTFLRVAGSIGAAILCSSVEPDALSMRRSPLEPIHETQGTGSGMGMQSSECCDGRKKQK